MTNQERYQKYIQEHCKNCKNNKTILCDIRIAVRNDVIETKCMFYEKKGKGDEYGKHINRRTSATNK